MPLGYALAELRSSPPRDIAWRAGRLTAGGAMLPVYAGWIVWLCWYVLWDVCPNQGVESSALEILRIKYTQPMSRKESASLPRGYTGA